MAFSEISTAAKSGHARGILYAGMVGLIVSDIVPTPADALYFWVEKKLRDKWKRGEITPQRYWTLEALAYYGLNPLWWITVFVVTLSIPGGISNQLWVAGSLIAAGAVIGVLYKNAQSDISELQHEPA